ncbi:MAG: sialate O-acetylesterase [Cytophagaceae bacterium]|nr:sialate O-acetylesterase [Cytophagaceae bacterium]
MSRLYTIFIFLMFISFSGKTQDPNFHIYLCIGQSNMEGSAAIETQDMTVDPRFQVMGAVNCTAGSRSFTIGEWSDAIPPLFRCYTRLGPADYFGRTMVANLPATIKVGIVPVAIGGCDIALFDKVNYASYTATAPGWMQNAIKEYGGNPYGRLVEVAKIAQKSGVIKGILYHQGETNTGQADWPMKLKNLYDNLIKDLNLNPAYVPLLVGEVVTTEAGGCCGAHNEIIANVPDVILNSYIISAKGLAAQDDHAHFTSAAYRTFGERYAKKMLSLLAPPKLTLTSPVPGDSFVAPARIKIQVKTDGAVKEVQFYNDSVLLGSDTSLPYGITWKKVSTGTYKITAKTISHSGDPVTSEAVMVTVSDPVDKQPSDSRRRKPKKK